MNEVRALSSSVFDEIAEVIGVENARKLCDALGGTYLYVPAAIGIDHPIAEALGPKVAKAFADHFKGADLHLPKAHHRRQRAIALIKAGELTDQQIALRTDYSDRQIRNLRADLRDDRQLSLFG